MTTSPVLLLLFNRPGKTSRVFEAIRKARPPRLYLAADGPRADHPDDETRCSRAREVVSEIDWPCEVKRLYRDQNLGCKMGVSSGISWFFEHEEQGIILEDDCLPHPDFFRFCDSLLSRYAEDDRVWVITGSNFQDGQKRGEAAYYFSKYNHVWGWASWRTAWRHYEGDIPFWPEWRESDDWARKTPDPAERRYWEEIFDRIHEGEIDTWDYPWTASVWYHGGLTATPNVNLVSNIGFGPDATHTVKRHEADGRKTEALGPLSHPDFVEQDLEADRYTFEHTFRQKELRWPAKGLEFVNKAIRYIWYKIFKK